MRKPSISIRSILDRDMNTLLGYLYKSLRTKNAVMSFLNTPSEEYFGMTPIELMVSSGDKGPRLILQSLACNMYYKSNLAA